MIQKRCKYGCLCDNCFDKHIANCCDYGQKISAYVFDNECTCGILSSQRDTRMKLTHGEIYD